MTTSVTTITEIAAQVIDPIVGADTRTCTTLGADRYEISEVCGVSDEAQIITSNHGTAPDWLTSTPQVRAT
ncbi:hypothetical protein [Corynebacterium kalidii]